jgi:AcrR family transcriptional regulator
MATGARKRVDRRTRDARAQGRDPRAALVAAAARVFAKHGFAGSSMDEIAEEAGFSKGALYWHFDGKEDLFFVLIEERFDRPFAEMIELLESAPPDQDVSPEASRTLLEFLQQERETILLEQEFWALAARDRKLRARYAKRRRELRKALAKALSARAGHLGTPAVASASEEMATAYLALASGLALEKLIDPSAVPDHLFGETVALTYAGLVARAQRADQPAQGS